MDERSTTVLETFEEGHALINSFESHVVLFAVSLVGGLSSISFVGSSGHLHLSLGDEGFISSDEIFESSSLWVEGVLEMSRSDTESDSGVSESLVDLVLKFVVLGFGPSVFFLFTTQFKVKVSNKVLEGGNEFIHWSTSLYLEF